MNSTPSISVLMPVYNGGPFLKEAVESILAQSLTDFELIIINDASTDDSGKYLSQLTDSRIRLFHHDSNKKLITTLNEGLALCKGKYIARMDADDKSDPDRFKKQVAFLETNPDVAVLGTAMKDVDGKHIFSSLPLIADDVKSALFFTCALNHPTVMLRNEIFQKENFHYDPAFPHSEDFDLWIRISEKYKLANLNEPLLSYRLHQDQVSKKYNSIQREGIHRCLKRQLQNIKVDFSPVEEDLHYNIADLNFQYNLEFLSASEKWFLKLIKANEQSELYEKKSFKKMIGSWWYNVFSTLLLNNVKGKELVKNSALSSRKTLGNARYFKFLSKDILGKL